MPQRCLDVIKSHYLTIILGNQSTNVNIANHLISYVIILVVHIRKKKNVSSVVHVVMNIIMD
jgi:hypothetical protein